MTDLCLSWECSIWFVTNLNSIKTNTFAQSAGAVEYTDCTSAEG